LFLYRDRVKELEFRFGLGKHKLDLEYVLVFAELLLRRIFVYSVNGKLLARFKGGVISLPAVGFASLLIEPFEKIYRVFDYKGRVLDVGGYLGETAYLFKKWGAEEVVVYEPEHQLAKHVRETMQLNKVKGLVYESFVNCSTSHNSVGWIDVLKNGFEVAKVDCEGCEKHLLSLPDDLIRKVPKWVIECHGPETLRQLCEKFLKAGFKVTFKPYIWGSGYELVGRDMVFSSQIKLPRTQLFIMTARLS
jgi:predicted RNA methylase